MTFNIKRMNAAFGGLLTLLGILVLIFPAFWVKLFVVIFGLAAIAYGIYAFIPLKGITDNSRYRNMIIIKGCASIIIGILSVIIPIAVVSTAWKIIVYVFACALILISALGFYSVSLLNKESPNRGRFILENLLILLGAVILFLISPEKLGATIIRIVGVAAIICGLLWIIIDLTAKKNSNTIVVEADVVDEVIENKTEESSEVIEDKSE